ncbi:MAG: IPT/TIG domain-containing protein [Janthinobacterium lividum]
MPAKADVTVAVTPAGPVSACGGPTLTAVATTKPFALTGTGVGGYPHVTALQPDGKILVGGYFDSYNGSARGGVLRLNANGSLDPTFAPTGTGINYDVDAMVLQPDGKVLIGGKFSTYNGASCRYLTRLNADGTRDASFNLTGTGLNSFVQSLALQPDGKIMVGGVFSNYNSTIRNAVLRLNADGSLDTSFSIAGTGIVGNIGTIAVQADGRLLVGGYIERFNGASPGSLVRLYPDGSLDNSFRVTPLSGSTVLTQTIQPDNKILISGAIYGPNGRQQSIVRLLTNGSLDYSFSPVGSGLNSAVQAMAVQPDGKVVVAGNFNEYNGLVHNYVARLNADGTLDNGFTATGTGPSYAPDDMVLQPNGKVVIVGSFSNYNGTGTGKIVRLNADGTLDATATPTAGATYAWSPTGTIGATVVPTLAGGSYQAVATVNGSLYLSNTVAVTPCLNAPAITSFTPASGPVGTVLTVDGTNLTGATSVTFSGSTSNVVSSGFTVNAAGTQLTGLVVPAGAQTGPFSISTSGGLGSSPGSFTVTAPVITSLSPASVVAGSGALTLTVNGANFVRGATVSLNGVNLATTYLSATQLTAAVPNAATSTAGSYPVRVANSAVSGSSTSAAVTFTVTVPAPTIISFTPASGLAGTAVTVTGTNLTGATAVTLNAVAVPSFVVANATTLIFTVPAGATSGLIVVTTPGGTATSASPFLVGTPNLVPVITALAPSSILVNSGDFTLTVNGGNFVRSSVVNFPLGPVATTYVSGNQLTAVIPAAYLKGLGSGNVTVTSPAPGGGTSNGLLFSVTLPDPTIISFTPTSGPVGTTVTVKGTNFQLVKYVGLASPGNSNASFTVLDANTLTFVVPAPAVSGQVGVLTSGGTGYSTAIFTVTPPPNLVPTITGLAPNTAVAGSGAFTLLVNGTGFISSSLVSFNGAQLATTYVSATQLTAQVPASALATAGTAGITVTSPAPGGGTSAAATFTVTTPAPTLVSFTPAQGLVGTSVTITGTNLTGASSLTLNGLSVGSFTVVDAGTLTFVVPVGATSGLLAVTTPGGTATSTTAFTVTLPAPTIANLAPSTAVAGSSDFTLVVNGTGFLAGSVVSFNGAVLVTTYGSATQLTAAVPAAAISAAGTYAVVVANPSAALGGTSTPVTFTVTTPAPTLVSFAPASGLAGTTVTVTGTALTGASAVTLNGTSVGSFTVVDAATLTFIVPANATSGLVAVTTPGGTATSASSFTVLLPNPLPTLAGLTPGSVTAGTPAFPLTVTGTGFVTGSVVQLAGVALVTAYQSATQLTAQVPASAVAVAGSYGVTVASPAPGGGTTAELALVVTLPVPTIASFTPGSGAAGTTVTVVGANFNGATALTLNGSPVTDFTVASPAVLSFVVPAGASSGLVAVITPGGTATSATAFTVIMPNPVPAIAVLSPASAVAGSSAITLTVSGSGFTAGSVVSFNGTALQTTYTSATQLTAQVPAAALATAGSYDVLVASPAPGGGTSAAATFTVTTPAPTLVSFAPAQGLAGTRVTVTGTNLTGASALTLNGVSIGSFTVVNAATLTFVVPVGATSGLLAVTTPGGTASSASSFTVLLPTPTIASLAPTTVVAGSGDFTLTVTGTGFISGSVINFGTTALPTTYGSATQLTAQVPASLVAAAGSVSVAVANPSPEQGGTSAAATFTITAPAIPAPTLVSFTPGSGLVGTAVTVTGTNLLGATVLTLNGVRVGSFTVVNATTLTFVVPTGASSGLLTVATPGGTATSASSFTVLLPNPAPTISRLSPASAVAGSGATTLTVTGTGYVNSSVVQFNGVALPTTFVSATQLTATVPATALATAGTYAVIVENPAPGGGTSPGVSFTVVTPAPTLASFTPDSGPVGTLVTVTGTDLTGATALTLNGIPVAIYTVLNASSLTFTVPVGATSGLVSVTTPGGTATSATAFTVIIPNPVPTLASLSPSTVVAGSGAFTLALTGTGFGSGSAVLFNGTALATTYVSATQLTAQVPASAVATAGSYDVLVRNPAPGGGVSAALPFVVTVPAPTISSFTPTMGGASTLVTVTGTNLNGATQVRIGSALIPTFTVVSATSLTLVVPAVAGGVSGYLSITTPGGTAISTMAFGGVLAATGSQALAQLQVYPNPFQSKLTLVLPSAEPVQVLLRDITGRVVLPLMPLPASKQLVLPTDLATGVYLLEIHQGDATTTRRLLKE